MTVLRERKVWRHERPANETRRASDLTPEEQSNVVRALAFLRVRHGGWPSLAKSLRATEGLVRRAGRFGRAVTAGLALRAARLAGVPVEDVLSGRWPPEGACPHCGRV